jgi:hypothetical protein
MYNISLHSMSYSNLSHRHHRQYIINGFANYPLVITGILLSIGASHPAITIQKFMIFPPDSIERFSSLCRPQVLLHPNRLLKYILMMVATIPHCLFCCIPFKTTSSTPKQQKTKAGIEHKNGHLPIKFPLKKEMIPQISLQPLL